jgi:hypothetical protein
MGRWSRISREGRWQIHGLYFCGKIRSSQVERNSAVRDFSELFPFYLPLNHRKQTNLDSKLPSDGLCFEVEIKCVETAPP